MKALIKSLYQQIHVGIVVQKNSAHICIQMRKGKQVEKELTKSFPIIGAKPSVEMNEFIKLYMDESPFSYISILNDSISQGAIPTCSMHEADGYNDISTAITLCKENRWMVYSQKSELNDLQKRFAKNGVDFIFSPFFILESFFADKVNEKTALYVLVQENYLSLAVFKEGDLFFGKHYCTADELEDNELSAEIDEDVGNSLSFDLDGDDDLAINLDDIDALDELDDLDNLDNLQDLDDLDDLDDIEDFEESLDEAVEESEVALAEAKSPIGSGGIDSFGDDYKRFQLIQIALGEFYGDSKYNNQFVEEVYIADACESGGDLTHFIEEELFVSVYRRSIELEKELITMALKELKDAS